MTTPANCIAPTYAVTVLPKHPAYGDRGAYFEIEAPTKAEAIRLARARVRMERLYGRHDGPLISSAERV